MMRSTMGPALLSLTLSSGGVASADAPGLPSRYIVFTLDATGGLRPQFHAVVSLASRRASRTEDELSTWLRSGSAEHEHVAVRLADASGRVVFREAVSVPRWQRTEHGLHGAGEPGAFLGDSMVPLAERAFVVRVPWLAGSRLQVALRSTLQPEKAAVLAGDFDLDALAEDRSLALARYQPETRLLTAPAPNSGNRVDLLVMGDGYTAGDKFTTDTTSILNLFFGISPYAAYKNYFNVTSLFTSSSESGADHPPYAASCQATYPPTCCADPAMSSDPMAGKFVNTAFDASYCTSNIHRLLTVNFTKTLAAAAASPDWDQILVVVNDNTYGGAGGGVSVVSTNTAAVDVAQHEFGHTFTRLADEYSYGAPSGPLCSEGGGSDTCEVNVTAETSRSLLKWVPWVLPATPLPTPPDEPAFATVVGLFEGARYRTTGMYRPQLNCLMNTLNVPFCAICSQEFVLRLYRGGWGVPSTGISTIEPGSENPAPGVVSLAVPGSQTFSVALLQPTGGPLTVTWTVNGVLVAGATSSSYTFTAATPGQYQVQVTVRDATPLVHPAMAGSSLVRTRAWTVNAGPLGDLSITKRDSGSAKEGQPLVYTLVASNAGPDQVTGATVADVLPPQIAGATWTCSASATSSCPGSGTGSVNALVNLSVGGSATFTITGTVAAGSARQIVNTARVIAPSWLTEINPANNSATITTAVGRPLKFYTVPPCRLVDTRGPDAPALAGNTSRTFQVAGRCQIPPSAWAASVNLTVTQPTEPGNLRAFAAGIPLPFASSLNYAMGQTRGNNLTLSLSAAGQASVFCGQAAGTTHLILDVNGYFE